MNNPPSMKMNIVQIGATYVAAQKIIESAIHNCLKEQGHKSHILYSFGIAESPDIIKYENFILKFIKRILNKVLWKSPKWSIFQTFKIIRLIKKINPDVVHLHIIHHGYIDYILLCRFLSKKSIPVVFTMHDMWSFTGGCYYYSGVNCTEFQHGCNKCPQSSDKLDCPVKTTSFHLSEKQKLFSELSNICFVAVSSWVHNELQKSSMKHFNSTTIYNAYENSSTEIYDFDEKKKGGLFKIIAVANSWSERKGLNRLLELAQLLNSDYEIILVGHVLNKNDFKKFSNITLVGTIADKKELEKLYALSHIHLSMSIEETFGLTFIEAAFSGIKSIGLNATAVPAILSQLDGYIIDQPYPLQAAKLIEHLNRNRNECFLTIEQILEIKKFFSTKRMANQYLKIYSQMIDPGTT